MPVISIINKYFTRIFVLFKYKEYIERTTSSIGTLKYTDCETRYVKVKHDGMK